MMFLNPAEGVRIQELLTAHRPMAAAQVLLSSTNRDHKAIRPLKDECVRQLMADAQTLLEKGQSLTARKHVRQAAQLLPLSGADALLQTQIETAATEEERLAADRQAAVLQAKDLAEQGRLHTAMESLAPYDQLPEANDLLHRLRSRDATTARHVAEFQNLLQQGNVPGAAKLLAKIREVAPAVADALGLEGQLMAAKQQLRAANKDDERLIAPTPRIDEPKDAGAHQWLLDFGDERRNTMLDFSDCLVIGSVKPDGTRAQIHIAAHNWFHQQHALILRHLRHDRMCYWLLPHPSNGNDVYIAVNNKPLTTGGEGLRPWRSPGNPPHPLGHPLSELGCALLQDGDLVQMGADKSNHVRLRFRQQAKSQEDREHLKLRATACMQFEADSPGDFQFGKIRYRNLAMVHENVRLGQLNSGIDVPLPLGMQCALGYHLASMQILLDCVDGDPIDVLYDPEGELMEDGANTIADGVTLMLRNEYDGNTVRIAHRRG